MTAAEQELLRQHLDVLPGPVTAAAQQAARVFSASLLALLLLWVVLVWPAGAIFHRNWGPASGMAPQVFALLVVASAGWAILGMLRRHNSGQDGRSLLQADIAGGTALEEHCRFVAAMRFQEREHGGLIYFLRTEDDRVLVLYDHESQELGASGDDPLVSGFQPRTEYVMARAPRSNHVMTQEFSGAALDAGEPVPLMAPPEAWPEHQQWCSIPWNDLRSRLSNPPGKTA